MEEEDNGKVSRTTMPVPPYLTEAAMRISRGGSKSMAFNAVYTADTASWVPRSWKRVCACNKCCGTAPEVARAHCWWHPITLRPPAPFCLPENAASKGAPTPCALDCDAHYSTTLRATPKTVTEYSPPRGSLPTKERLFRALLIRGSKADP